MTAFVDTDVLVRHLTGDPAELAARATAFLYAARDLLLTDLVVAETVDVLDVVLRSAAGIDRARAAFAARLRGRRVRRPRRSCCRAVEVYETASVSFAGAYLVACAESTGVRRVRLVRPRRCDRVSTVDRIEPP